MMLHIRHALLKDNLVNISWKVSLIRGCVIFKVGISSFCLIYLRLMHEHFSLQAAASWPDPPAAQTVRIWVLFSLRPRLSIREKELSETGKCDTPL